MLSPTSPPSRLTLPLGCLALTVALAHADGVAIATRPDGYHVTATTYEAVVGTDGCFPSLRVDGVEFFEAAESFPRGAYCYQGGILRLPQVEQVGDAALAAKGDKASARYEFAADTMTWTVTNLTDERLLLIIVFDPMVKAVMDEQGLFEQAPIEMPSRLSTWFREGSRLRIEGSTRLWGPWSGDHQVWELSLKARETREVKLSMGKATDDQAAQAAEAAARVRVPPSDPVGPMWDLETLFRPPAVTPAEGFEAEGVKAIFYEGLPFRGKPTRVFAWIGLPQTKPGEKVPGMVLVHGGGGTAFDTWVRLWTSRGYAAIAMDTCGCVPRGSYGDWERDPQGGPPGWGGFSQIDWPREDQWTYHAVADALLAHSLLLSQPEVDPERTGITGISWGGYLTCILAGVDRRFRLAVPVYGCGYYLDTSFGGALRGLGGERADRWMRWWDPSVYLKDASMPMLWVTGSNDFAYWFPALQQSYRATSGPHTLCVRLRMPHGHGPPGENPEEIRVFADSLLKGGAPLATVTGQGRDGDRVWATFHSAVPIVRAELNYTKATGNWPDRVWESAPAQLDGAGRVTATLSEGTTVYYLNLVDERDLVVSTEHVDLER